MMQSFLLGLFVIGAMLSLTDVCWAKPPAPIKSVAKHAHEAAARASRSETAEKAGGHELVRVPRTLPNGWRRVGEEVGGGTGF